MGEGGLRQQHRAPQVHVEDLLPGVGGDVLDHLGQGGGSVVDHDVDAAEALDGGVDEGPKVVGLAEVGGNSQSQAAHGLECGLGLGAGVGLAAGHDHVGAGRGEAFGDGAPDAPGAPGDDGHPAREVEELVELRPVHPLVLAGGGVGAGRHPRPTRLP